MGRQLYRVPLDFKWDMDKVWKGFICPIDYDDYALECHACEGTGWNKETRELADTFYDSEGHGVRWCYKYDDEGRACEIIETYPGACRRWLDKLTQDEVDALVDDMRFTGRTHDWIEGKGWVLKTPRVTVTAEEVNKANAVGARGMGHDALNRNTLIRTRGKRLGVYGHCTCCNGEGRIIFNPDLKKKSDEWEPEDPPEGEGWQVWETVSEGSPVTPVFATAEALIDHLVNVGVWGRRYSREAAEAFVYSESGWVPSAVGISGVGWVDGIAAAPYLKAAKED